MSGGGRGVVRGILRAVGTGVCELARPRRVDTCEVDVRVDSAESEAKSHQHQQDYQTHEHDRITSLRRTRDPPWRRYRSADAHNSLILIRCRRLSRSGRRAAVNGRSCLNFKFPRHVRICRMWSRSCDGGWMRACGGTSRWLDRSMKSAHLQCRPPTVAPTCFQIQHRG